ncbi:flavodoxin domain-containing protein [Methanocella sp. MCL-LM]|uniref:flavodoxin domain-containing protein n=1 Tax=Methanocella sp. MCL-LM TaxID=3412035 RepID=UPI003C745AF8
MADVLIIYDTISGTTKKAAEFVLEGVKSTGAEGEMTTVTDVSVAEMQAAGSIVMGSPCINDNISGRMREFVAGKLKDARLGSKPGAAFGTHKWNSGNLHRLETEMRYEGIRLVTPGVNARHMISSEDERALKYLGEAVGREAQKAKTR